VRTNIARGINTLVLVAIEMLFETHFGSLLQCSFIVSTLKFLFLFVLDHSYLMLTVRSDLLLYIMCVCKNLFILLYSFYLQTTC